MCLISWLQVKCEICVTGEVWGKNAMRFSRPHVTCNTHCACPQAGANQARATNSEGDAADEIAMDDVALGIPREDSLEPNGSGMLLGPGARCWASSLHVCALHLLVSQGMREGKVCMHAHTHTHTHKHARTHTHTHHTHLCACRPAA